MDNDEGLGFRNGQGVPSEKERAAPKVIPYRSVILLMVFIDLFGVGLAMPLVTPLIKQLGATPMQVGLLSSVYGAVQLISSPFMGLLSDRLGRKMVILLSYMGAMLGYLLLGFSSTLQLVVVSRIITGSLKHSQNAIKAYVADHTNRGNRAVELGRMATASGLGIMVGPTVGGFLFKVGGYALPLSFAASLYVLNSSLVLGLLPPDQIPSRDPAAEKGSHGGGRVMMPWYRQALPQVSMLVRPRVAALFAVRLVLGLAVQTFRQGFSLMLFYRFNFGVRDNGLLISYQGALASLVQGFAIQPLVRMFDDGPLILRGMLLLAFSFVACSWSPTVAILVVMLTPVALSTGVLRTTFAAVLTAIVPQDEVGQILGLSDAAMSACRVVGPALAGALATWMGPSFPGLCSGVLMLAAAGLFRATGCVSSYRSPPSSPQKGGTSERVNKLDLREREPLLPESMAPQQQTNGSSIARRKGEWEEVEVKIVRSKSWHKDEGPDILPTGPLDPPSRQVNSGVTMAHRRSPARTDIDD